MPDKFDVTICTRDAVDLYGVSVLTTMEKASVDCPHLWESVFAPRMSEVSGKPPTEIQGDSYGISVRRKGEAIDEFVYIAAMKPGEGVELPEGMERFELAGGPYVRCDVPSLGDLSDAFCYIYGRWEENNPDYRLDRWAPGFELYGPDFMQTGEFAVFAPLLPEPEQAP